MSMIRHRGMGSDVTADWELVQSPFETAWHCYRTTLRKPKHTNNTYKYRLTVTVDVWIEQIPLQWQNNELQNIYRKMSYIGSVNNTEVAFVKSNGFMRPVAGTAGR